MYLLFIDLVKAYDSVSRTGLWGVLKTKGVPADLPVLIRTYYSNKTCQIATEGVLSEEFTLTNGLGQGCCLAVMESWLKTDGPRTSWFTRVDGVLRRQALLSKYAIHQPWSFQEFGFADDLALATDTLDKLRTMHRNITNHLSAWGLTLSELKTEALVTLLQTDGALGLPGETGDKIKFTLAFKYLGSFIDWELTCDVDILHRVDQARKAFWRLNSSVWDVQQLRLSTKLSVYRACVLSVFLYGSETWTAGWMAHRKLKVFHMMCLRKISRVTRWRQQREGITNDNILQFLGVPTIAALLDQARLRWMGHVARMDNNRLPKQALFSFLPPEIGVHRLPGKQKGKRLRDAMVNSLQCIDIPLSAWVQMACVNEGKDWKLKTRTVACWYTPFPPRGRQDPPDRTVEHMRITNAPLRTRKKGWEQELAKAQADLADTVAEGPSYLAWEQTLTESPWATASAAARELYGQDWLDLEPDSLAVELVLGNTTWEPFFLTTFDFTLLASVVETAQALEHKNKLAPLVLSPMPAKPARTRLRQKQRRPPAFVLSSSGPSDAPAHPAQPVEKYWAAQQQAAGEGEHVCPLPHCSRKFPTKAGLSHHVMLVHREGSYRDQNWECPHCPRSFELEAGLTKHLPLYLLRMWCIFPWKG